MWDIERAGEHVETRGPLPGRTLFVPFHLGRPQVRWQPL